jgi:hypothetical protein
MEPVTGRSLATSEAQRSSTPMPSLAEHLLTCVGR